MLVIKGLEGLKEVEGKHIGFSDWVVVDQERIDTFAKASGDYQWIHVDPERAKDGPFGATIAHGVLTLAMTNALTKDLFKFDGFRMVVNYGYEKIRFPTPVKVGTAVRAGLQFLELEEHEKFVQTPIEVTVEAQGSDKPACVARMTFRHYL